MTSLREGFPIVYVRDMRAALAFYCDLLGFAETYRNPPGSETPAFVSLKLDETTKLALAEHGVPDQIWGNGLERASASSCGCTRTMWTQRSSASAPTGCLC